jgi:hypothetical protein
MIRHFCDLCGKEAVELSSRVVPEGGGRFYLRKGTSSTSSHGGSVRVTVGVAVPDLCLTCEEQILAAILDENRERQKHEEKK